MERQPDATIPMLVIGLGDYGRRLLWVLEQHLQQAGQEAACILYPPQANGSFDAAALMQGTGVAAALVIADGFEADCAVRLEAAARALAADGIRAYVLLAEPANVSTGARWAGAFAGSMLFPYADNTEWRQVRAQMADLIEDLLQPEGVRALPDWQRLFAGMAGCAATPAAGGLCAHAA